jgi:hypothetical protein
MLCAVASVGLCATIAAPERKATSVFEARMFFTVVHFLISASDPGCCSPLISIRGIAARRGSNASWYFAFFGKLRANAPGSLSPVSLVTHSHLKQEQALRRFPISHRLVHLSRLTESTVPNSLASCESLCLTDKCLTVRPTPSKLSKNKGILIGPVGFEPQKAALEEATYASSVTGPKLEILQELITQSGGWTES